MPGGKDAAFSIMHVVVLQDYSLGHQVCVGLGGKGSQHSHDEAEERQAGHGRLQTAGQCEAAGQMRLRSRLRA